MAAAAVVEVLAELLKGVLAVELWGEGGGEGGARSRAPCTSITFSRKLCMLAASVSARPRRSEASISKLPTCQRC